MNDLNLEDWLVEFDIPNAAAQGDPAGMQAPMTQPNSPEMQNDPNVANMDSLNAGENLGDSGEMDELGDTGDQEPPEDITNDPQTPDMPEQNDTEENFEIWKKNFFKESIKGDSNKLIDLIQEQRDKDLNPYQRKFVEDNFNIQLLRQNSNIEKASKDIRNNIRQDLDKNNPATSLVNHIHAVLETIPLLNNVFVKLTGYTGLKGDLHRKYISALLSAVQVGSGADTEDIIFNERNYSIPVSTRFNSKWGDVYLGTWSLREDDPERYLSDPELKRLIEGSPEERDVLRRRIVMESIAEIFETRSFIVNVVAEDGVISTLGWDLASSIRNAYTEGVFVVKVRNSDNSEAMIDDEGEIVPLLDLTIYYVKETGEQDAMGMPAKEESPFIERRNGMLFLVADYNLLKEVSNSMVGMNLKEIPFNGNPSDLENLRRCIYSAHDLLMRQC